MLQPLTQRGEVDRLVLVARHAVDDRPEHFFEHAQRLVLQALPLQRVLALAVDELALLVHHLVVFEEVLADVEVARLDLLLRAGDAARDHRAVDDLAGLEAHLLHHHLHPVAGEDAHEVVVERQEEPSLTRIALATAAATQLVVDAARFVAFGADHVETAERQDLVVLLLAV